MIIVSPAKEVIVYEEPKVEGCCITGIDRTTNTTQMEIYFNTTMKKTSVEDSHAYSIEIVDGLEKDYSAGSVIYGIPSLFTRNNYNDSVLIKIKGIIASTTEENLPRVMINKDLKASSGVSLRDEDIGV